MHFTIKTLSLIPFYCCDKTFSTLLSFYCRDETFADPIDLVSPKVGKIIPALFLLPAGNLPDDRVSRVETERYSSVCSVVKRVFRVIPSGQEPIGSWSSLCMPGGTCMRD